MADPSILIKLGGIAASVPEQLDMLARELSTLAPHVAIVHGGGKEVSELSRRLGLEPVFHEGVRMTSDAEMDIVEMILSGLANKRLVRRFVRGGLRAVGISGADAGSVVGACIPDAGGAPSRTARVLDVSGALIRHLWAGGYLPVVSSSAADETGEAVNINADDVAFALAGALEVSSLIFLSDVPGVVIDDEPVRSLTPATAAARIASGDIAGGMIPKVRNAMTALEHGVAQVVIGSYEQAGDLGAMIEGRRGTRIVAPQRDGA